VIYFSTKECSISCLDNTKTQKSSWQSLKISRSSIISWTFILKFLKTWAKKSMNKSFKTKSSMTRRLITTLAFVNSWSEIVQKPKIISEIMKDSPLYLTKTNTMKMRRCLWLPFRRTTDSVRFFPKLSMKTRRNSDFLLIFQQFILLQSYLKPSINWLSKFQCHQLKAVQMPLG